MGDTATMVRVLVELGAVSRLDAIIAVNAAGEPGALDSYSNVIDWAVDLAVEEGTVAQWEAAVAANTGGAGDLVLIDIERGALLSLTGLLAPGDAETAYTATLGSAIGWALDVCAANGRSVETFGGTAP